MALANVENIVGRQLRMYERAHHEALELKPLGYEFRARGLDLTKLYANPNFLLLPFEDCPHLSKLTLQQRSRISAAFYGTIYADVADHETRVIVYNLQVSDRVFPRYSDGYMVLFAESDEECDHVTTFRCLWQPTLGDVGGSWREPGPQCYAGLDAAFERLGGELCAPGYGALFLLHRFLLNLMLKQTESFMHVNLPGRGYEASDYDPLALQITHAHATDEARHYTTSLQLGLGLFSQASPESRKQVRSLISVFAASLIRERFAAQPTRTRHFAQSMEALRVALHAPEFADLGQTTGDLLAFWKREGIEIPQRQEYDDSRRWMARELLRLIDQAELRIPSSEDFERLQDLARSK